MIRLRAVTVHILLLVAVVAAGFGAAHAVDPRVSQTDIGAMREAAARQAGQDFLDRYVEDDGRVVRRDEGGDVVSEGQAYGMLIAAAVSDEDRFRSIWDWTKTQLRRPDGLLSWRWADRRVADANSATDADLDAARALVLAGRRFGAQELIDDGKRLGADIMRAETAEVGAGAAPPADMAPQGRYIVGGGRMTVAGNWATAPPHAVNPGYFSPRAEEELFRVSADRRWQEISRTQRTVAWQLTGVDGLPPDWAAVNPAGHAAPMEPPGGGAVNFGLDAARLPVRFAESCDPGDRALAASMRDQVAAPGNPPAVRNLDGSTAGEWQHPLALVSAAAAETAAGEDDAAAERLDQASSLLQRYPTYYGAAWVALGRIMLATTLLGECPQGGARFLQGD
ncbi:glycosyl hydrolase family 8 [Mycolicibacterium celeriflavum]|uniref:glycosyl hydrolase family 8 n=1 Tax=Mycolicibacterium celeriflavum TaxID=1249101 RepID=UPI003CE95332